MTAGPLGSPNTPGPGRGRKKRDEELPGRSVLVSAHDDGGLESVQSPEAPGRLRRWLGKLAFWQDAAR